MGVTTAPGPVSLYVPAFNAERYVARCIESILAQTLRPDEILVVDDGSTDRTAEIARGYSVAVVAHGANKGLAAARNTGVRAARNNLVAALDADCVPQPDWLERLAARFAGERTALGGGRLEEAVQKTAADRFRKLHLVQNWGTAPIRNPRYVFGSNTLLRKDRVEEAGWYDERFRTNYEDLDLSNRLRARDYETFYEPSAVVHHLKEDDDASILRAMWRYNQLGYRRAINLPNVLGRIGQNGLASLRFVLSDSRTEDWGVLRLDLQIPLSFARWDWRLLRESRGR